MAVPASVFRPTPVEDHHQRREVHLPSPEAAAPAVAELLAPQLPSPRLPIDESQIRAGEFEALISPIGRLRLPAGQQLKFPAALGGRTATMWADERSIHVLVDGELARTRPSQLAATDLKALGVPP